MPRISRFLLYDSDRSGFKHFKIELVKDGPYFVEGEEFDTPPPSRVPLGGEGDISGEFRSNSDFTDGATATDTANVSIHPTVYITAAGGITPSFTHPWMRVTGSNAAVTISTTPQIARGRQGQILTLQCVDSAITLAHGSANAINFMDSRGTLQLTSGMVITFIYNSGSQVWWEASRYRP